MEVGACEALPGPRGEKGCVVVQTELSGSPSQDEAHRAVRSLTACCGLNGSPRKTPVSELNTQGDGIRGWLGLEGGARMNGVKAFIRRHREETVSLSAVRGHSEETAVCRLGGVSPRASHAGTSLRNSQKEMSVVEAPQGGVFLL